MVLIYKFWNSIYESIMDWLKSRQCTVFTAGQVCFIRLDTLDALQCTINVVFIAINTQNPHEM